MKNRNWNKTNGSTERSPNLEAVEAEDQNMANKTPNRMNFSLDLSIIQRRKRYEDLKIDFKKS
jgi:phage replication-related protein YjqB (UPF0714/DUF867 family)